MKLVVKVPEPTSKVPEPVAEITSSPVKAGAWWLLIPVDRKRKAALVPSLPKLAVQSPSVAKPPPASGTREPSTKEAGLPDVGTVTELTLVTFRSSEPESSKVPALKNEFQLLDDGSRYELLLLKATAPVNVLEPDKLQLTVEPPPSLRVKIISHLAMLGMKVAETISIAKKIFVAFIMLLPNWIDIGSFACGEPSGEKS